MTRVDFYVLGEQFRGDASTLACRLAEKAWLQGRRVYLHTGSPAETEQLDRLLWTFREGSFVPHGANGKVSPGLNPVLVGHDDQGGEEHDVLINLAPEVPHFFSRFDRVAELIEQAPEKRKQGRVRYAFYRDRGYPLQTHSLDK